MKDNFLHKYFLNNGSKTINKWIHYFDIYERYFNQYVDKPTLMIEIGVFKGGSIDMWKEYFGPKSIIVGIDIDPNCKKFERKDDGVFIEIGDQSDANFLQSVIDKYGNPDIVLDDGSHIMIHIQKSFDFLYYKMKENGTYMVEDLHTSYWSEYGGGLKRDNTFIEFSKNKIDEINANHSRGAHPITDFTKSTQSMHVYDSIVVFEKRPQGRRMSIQTGSTPLL